MESAWFEAVSGGADEIWYRAMFEWESRGCCWERIGHLMTSSRIGSASNMSGTSGRRTHRFRRPNRSRVCWHLRGNRIRTTPNSHLLKSDWTGTQIDNAGLEKKSCPGSHLINQSTSCMKTARFITEWSEPLQPARLRDRAGLRTRRTGRQPLQGARPPPGPLTG